MNTAQPYFKKTAQPTKEKQRGKKRSPTTTIAPSPKAFRAHAVGRFLYTPCRRMGDWGDEVPRWYEETKWERQKTNGECGVKEKTPAQKRGFPQVGRFFPLPIGFFGYPVFLTQTQIFLMKSTPTALVGCFKLQGGDRKAYYHDVSQSLSWTLTRYIEWWLVFLYEFFRGTLYPLLEKATMYI